jgi:hypothetical protein
MIGQQQVAKLQESESKMGALLIAPSLRCADTRESDRSKAGRKE